MEVARTILEQLGGRRFIAMTGAKNLVGGQNDLSFRLPGNLVKGRANICRIELTPADTYTITLLRMWQYDVKEIDVYRDVYADELQEVFTSMTGLDTHL